MLGGSLAMVCTSATFELLGSSVRADAKEIASLPLYQVYGRVQALREDVDTARKILDGAPNDSPLSVMEYLAAITQVSTTGEFFNERWGHRANPLIRQMFADIGYAQQEDAGDCTPWCAATISWCLQRCKLKIPPNAPVALSFKDYGQEATQTARGDIAVFENRFEKGSGHVGFYLSEDSASIIVLGANQSQFVKTGTECGRTYPNSRIVENSFIKNPAPNDSSHSLRLVARRRWSI